MTTPQTPLWIQQSPDPWGLLLSGWSEGKGMERQKRRKGRVGKKCRRGGNFV